VKRAIHILFWLSLATALVVFLLRRGASHDAPTDEEAVSPSPTGTSPVPAVARIPPPTFITPDAGSAPAQAAPVDPEVAAEMALMKQIRDNYRSNPAKAIEPAREARRRFGDSRDSDERDSMLIQAYLNSGDRASARAEMPYYYEHHPHGRWADYLFALTNVGPGTPP
jgi:hypothetical protein